MTPQKLYKENLPAIQAFAESKPIELSERGSGKWETYTGEYPAFAAERYTWRPKAWTLPRNIPGFRALVDGEEWHCASGWTENMMLYGWRPLLINERVQRRDEFFGPGIWVESTNLKMSPDFPYRTQRPLPPLKKTVPLGPDDVPPGSAIREKALKSWSMVVRVDEDGVEFIDHEGDSIYLYWDNLADGYKILRPGQDWQPCSKEVEVTE